MHFPMSFANRRAAAVVLLAWVLVSLPKPVSHAQTPLPQPSAAVDPSGSGAGDAAPTGGLAPTNRATIGYHLNLRGGFDHVARFTVPDAHLATVVGPQTANIYGMDYDGENIWGISQDTLQLGTIDQQTAVFTPTHSITGMPAGQSLTGLTIAADGTFYVSTSSGTDNTILTLNPGTGALAPIGQIAGSLIIALAINCAGELYAHDISGDRILRIPTNNPAGYTVVGPTGQSANFAQGMDFDDSTNTLYAWIYRGTGAGDFATINTSTGAATAVTPLTGEFEGLIMTTCAPKITSPLPAAGTYGQPYAHTFTATGSQTVTMSLGGTLPPGLNWDAATATIAGTPTLAGTYPDLLLTATAGGSTTQPFTLTINKASLTARPQDASRIVGQPNPAFTIIYTGFVGADTAANLSVAPSAQTAATISSPAGTYPITLQGGSDENYEFSYQQGTLTIRGQRILLPLIIRSAPAQAAGPGR